MTTTTARNAARINVATHSTYSEMLLLGSIPAHTLITLPHTHSNRRRGGTRRLCDSIGSNGKVILLSDDELVLARRGRMHFGCVRVGW